MNLFFIPNSYPTENKVYLNYKHKYQQYVRRPSCHHHHFWSPQLHRSSQKGHYFCPFFPKIGTSLSLSHTHTHTHTHTRYGDDCINISVKCIKLLNHNGQTCTILQSTLHLHTVRLLTEGDDTRGCGDTIGPPDDEQRAARNMLRSVV